MKSKLLYACVVLFVLVLVSWLIIHQMGKAEARVRKATCHNNVQAIGRAIEGYRKEHDGNYPMTLEELYPKYLEDRRSLRCFGDFGGGAVNANISSYTYYMPESSPSPRMIIVRDKPGNHSGMNGHWNLYINGETVWADD